jgi:hypothetical protein
VLKKVLLVILAVILLALPLAARWLYYYEGRYEPGKVPRPDLAQIELPPSGVEPFTDRSTALAPGAILVDVAHDNQFQMAELAVLRARLSSRGQRIEPLVAAEDLSDQLRYARALVIIAPASDWTPDEIDLVERFVKKGGRLLLVTDPTRYSITYDENGMPVVDDDVPHINDLAARFGLLFQADYLYNTADNSGNFRNIKLSSFAQNQLTQGLTQIVFFAAHSIVSEEPALIAADGETRSSSSDRAETLAVAVLAGGGSVLALGDMTFMTEPYDVVDDNDQLIAHIADYLAGAQREYDLADFPFFFGDQVDLVYAGDPILDSDLLQEGSVLQSLFADVGKELTVRAQEDKASDTLFFGLYQEAGEAEPYLAAAQVTLAITPTAEYEGKSESGPKPTPSTEATPVPSPVQSITSTRVITPSTEGATAPGPGVTQPLSITAQITPSLENRIEIGSLGDMVPTGTLLLLLQRDGARQVLVVLADTQAGLANAIDRLTAGDLEDCVLEGAEAFAANELALCPTGEVAPGSGQGGWQQPPSAQPSAEPTPVVTSTVTPAGPVGGSGGNIVVVSMDRGVGRYDNMTSVDDYQAILGKAYNLTVWSVDEKGLPGETDLSSYDLVIWTSGDHEDPLGDSEDKVLYTVMLDGVPVILSGAFLGDPQNEAVQRDIQVNDANDPLAQGFTAGQAIDFVAGPSGSEYETSVLEEPGEANRTVPCVRGPESEQAGAPAVVVTKDELSDLQVVFIGFPLYLLPDDAKSQLVLNTVDWMLNP